MKTVIYPGPNVAVDAGPEFHSARLGVSLRAGIPTAIEDAAADALLSTGTVRLPAMPESYRKGEVVDRAAPEPAPAPAPAPAREAEAEAQADPPKAPEHEAAAESADPKRGPAKAKASR